MIAREKAAQLVVDYQLTYRDSSYIEALNASVRVCQEIVKELDYEIETMIPSEESESKKTYLTSRKWFWLEVEEVINSKY